MSDEATPGGKKKAVPPVALAGGAVAIGAALYLVFSGKDADKADTTPATPQATVEQSADPNSPSVQTAQFGQSDPNAPAPPVPPSPDGASATSPDSAAVSFADESITYSAAFPRGPSDDPNLAYLRNDALSYLAGKKTDARATYDEFKAAGDIPAGYPWEVTIKWDYTAKAGDVVSLSARPMNTPAAPTA